MQFKTRGSSDSTVACENIYKENKLDLFSNDGFKQCYKYKEQSLSSAAAVYECLDIEKKYSLDIFLASEFQVCRAMMNISLGSSTAVDYCLHIHDAKKLSLFLDSNFLKCYELRNKSLQSHTAIFACIEEFKNAATIKALIREQVNENIQLPESTQVILTAPLEIPGNSACASVTNGERDVKCWVCRAKKTRNDVLYQLEKDEKTGVDQKILPIESSQLSNDGKEILFKLVQDPSDADNLSSVLCTSKSVLQIKNKSELVPMFEKNGLKLIFPAAKVK